MLNAIDHVGVAVEDLDSALELYRGPLGMPEVHREMVEEQGVEAVLLDVGTKGYAIVVPLVLWLMVLVPWLLRHDHWSPAQHQRGMYRALAAWAVTDLTVLFVFAT